jgi:hypothetical protein
VVFFRLQEARAAQRRPVGKITSDRWPGL